MMSRSIGDDPGSSPVGVSNSDHAFTSAKMMALSRRVLRWCCIACRVLPRSATTWTTRPWRKWRAGLRIPYLHHISSRGVTTRFLRVAAPCRLKSLERLAAPSACRWWS